MKNFYYTFGTDPQFPFGIEDYVVIEAVNINMANHIFMAKYPGPHENLVNCAFYYTEEEFNRFRDKYYKGIEPSDVIRVQTHEDIAALEIIDRLEWLADGLMELCRGADSTEKDEALAMRDAVTEIRKLRLMIKDMQEVEE